MRNFDEELRAIHKWRDEQEAELEKYFKKIGIPMGLDGVSNSDEGLQIRREWKEKLAILFKEYDEVKARGDEHIADGVIHNAKR
ncbi:MAG: hypothetical protein KH354_05275 [Clostridiales bacterium]|nr:hypothetical protein [Clostridiales bacterium]